MKPRRKDHRARRAAREKIASDLAYDLGISVPPVILADRANAGAEEAYVAVSLVMFPRQDSWDTVRRALERSHPVAEYYRKTLPTQAARAWAFDTWLGQADHQDANPDNIIFGYDPADVAGTGRFVFLDYAFSMGHLGSWDGEHVSYCPPASIPALMRLALDPEELTRMVAAIESVADGQVQDIVNRIPVSHLDSGERALIADGLMRRRDLVRATFDSAGVLQ